MFFPFDSYVLMSSPFREIITLVFSSDAARNTPTPLITHSSLLIVAPVPRPSDGIKGMLLIPRVKEPAAIRPSDATPSGRGIIMKMRLEDRIFHISMRRGSVGTSACSVRGFYSRKSHQSRQRFRAIFRKIRGIITQGSVPSDMPYDGIEVWIYNPRLRYRVTDPYTQKQRITYSP